MAACLRMACLEWGMVPGHLSAGQAGRLCRTVAWVSTGVAAAAAAAGAGVAAGVAAGAAALATAAAHPAIAAAARVTAAGARAGRAAASAAASGAASAADRLGATAVDTTAETTTAGRHHAGATTRLLAAAVVAGMTRPLAAGATGVRTGAATAVAADAGGATAGGATATAAGATSATIATAAAREKCAWSVALATSERMAPTHRKVIIQRYSRSLKPALSRAMLSYALRRATPRADVAQPVLQSASAEAQCFARERTSPCGSFAVALVANRPPAHALARARPCTSKCSLTLL